MAELTPVERKIGADDPYSAEDRECLTTYADAGFTAAYNSTLLDDDVFAILLGSVSTPDIEQSRKLQQLMHDERKERDRIINQLERRRRNAMRDAIERAEESRRAEAFRRLCAEHATNIADTGTAPKLIARDHADDGVVEGDGAFQVEESTTRSAVGRGDER
jgi:hypothetical protein